MSVHLCALSLTGTGCIPDTESFFGSPKTTNSGADFTVDYFGLEGRYRIWEDVPSGYTQTYPLSGALALGCGSNGRAAYNGYWILATRSGPAYLDLGNFACTAGVTPMGFWCNANGQALFAAGPTLRGLATAR